MKAPGLRGLIVIGALAYLAFLLVTFPAHVATRLLPDAVEASGVSGTLWRGQASSLRIDNMVVGETKWRLKPLALLTVRIKADVEIDLADGVIAAEVAATPTGRIFLADVAGVVPINALSGLIPTDMIDGRIGLDLASASLEDGWLVDAEGTVDVVDLRVIAPVAESLGNFELQFTGAGEESLDGRFRDTRAPLQANGTLVLHRDRRWVLDGSVSASQGASPQLSQALAMLGPRDNRGAYQVSLSGQL
ncbi:MAG: type II secretion system protein N [Gammaproteobacteria bacterium]|nr:type II secretion system protein N [Gammaproteobacteria bacterium]